MMTHEVVLFSLCRRCQLYQLPRWTITRPDRYCSRFQQPGMLPTLPHFHVSTASCMTSNEIRCQTRCRRACADAQTWGGQRSRSRLTVAATHAWLEAAPRSCVSAFRHLRHLRRTLRGAQPAAGVPSLGRSAAVCDYCCRVLHVHTVLYGSADREECVALQSKLTAPDLSRG